MQRIQHQGLYESRREHDGCGIGAVVNINGKRSHAIIKQGKQILLNLHHRGAAGADEVTGDGAGILFQIPHEFFSAQCQSAGFSLPPASKYGLGMVFGPREPELREKCDRILADSVNHYGMKVLGWRDVPTSNDCLGKIALQAEPTIKQLFVDGAGLQDELLEQKLYLALLRNIAFGTNYLLQRHVHGLAALRLLSRPCR
jgi:glutamate synthase domain-containing protein 1